MARAITRSSRCIFFIRVLATLKEVFGKAGKDDIVVFFFSGHGSKGGLCAYDTHNEQTLISYGEIKAVLRQCDANNKQLFIDACFSGGLRGGGKTSSASRCTEGRPICAWGSS